MLNIQDKRSAFTLKESILGYNPCEFSTSRLKSIDEAIINLICGINSIRNNIEILQTALTQIMDILNINYDFSSISFCEDSEIQYGINNIKLEPQDNGTIKITVNNNNNFDYNFLLVREIVNYNVKKEEIFIMFNTTQTIIYEPKYYHNGITTIEAVPIKFIYPQEDKKKTATTQLYPPRIIYQCNSNQIIINKLENIEYANGNIKVIVNNTNVYNYENLPIIINSPTVNVLVKYEPANGKQKNYSINCQS